MQDLDFDADSEIEDATFVVIENPFDSEDRFSVFADGSYSTWIPSEAEGVSEAL